MSDNFYSNGDSMIKNLKNKFSDGIKCWKNEQIAVFEKMFNWCWKLPIDMLIQANIAEIVLSELKINFYHAKNFKIHRQLYLRHSLFQQLIKQDLMLYCIPVVL